MSSELTLVLPTPAACRSYGHSPREHAGNNHIRWPQRRRVNQVSRPHEVALRDAESAYLMGRPLKAVAKEVGIGHERLSRLLRERGVRIRRQSPTPEQAVEMRTRYEEGTSLERIGAVLDYSAGTIRNHLLAAGFVLRDTHGRGEQELAVRQTAGR